LMNEAVSFDYYRVRFLTWPYFALLLNHDTLISLFWLHVLQSLQSLRLMYRIAGMTPEVSLMMSVHYCIWISNISCAHLSCQW
jgi:hypothetical protein